MTDRQLNNRERQKLNRVLRDRPAAEMPPPKRRRKRQKPPPEDAASFSGTPAAEAARETASAAAVSKGPVSALVDEKRHAAAVSAHVCLVRPCPHCRRAFGDQPLTVMGALVNWRGGSRGAGTGAWTEPGPGQRGALTAKSAADASKDVRVSLTPPPRWESFRLTGF